jgi:hypothetical protein
MTRLNPQLRENANIACAARCRGRKKATNAEKGQAVEEIVGEEAEVVGNGEADHLDGDRRVASVLAESVAQSMTLARRGRSGEYCRDLVDRLALDGDELRPVGHPGAWARPMRLGHRCDDSVAAEQEPVERSVDPAQAGVCADHRDDRDDGEQRRQPEPVAAIRFL